jgi:hypothetical protein
MSAPYESSTWIEELPAEGKKFDSGKVRVELLPEMALVEVAKVLAFGAEKYGVDNWRKGMAWRRLIGAALRHLWAWSTGVDRDEETGLSHLAHAACCVLFLIDYETRRVGTDDRFK